MSALSVVKVGLAVFACIALYFLAWPIPNYLERLSLEARNKRRNPADSAFNDYLERERRLLAAEKVQAERLDEELEERVAVYARTRGCTRSEAISRLVEAGLDAELRKGGRL
jgi:hypothetical protein